MKDKDSHLIFEKYITEAVKPAEGSPLDGMLNPEDLGLDADLNPLEDDEFVDYYMSKDQDAIQELVSYLEGQFEEGTDYVLHTERGDSKTELPNTVSIRKGFDDPELEELLDGARGAPEGEGEDDELNWFEIDDDEDEDFADKDDPNPWA